MESFSGDTEEETEDTEGHKKSKFRFLKSRLFKRSKKIAAERNAKLSQSASDIAAGKGLGSDEDLVCSQGMMGSRALSHDSIFLADQVLSDAEPDRVLSQENVHSKIKTLQMKLQQQKLHLGPPPLVMPVRHQDELGRRSENDGRPHSPPETSGGDSESHSVLSKTIFPASSSPLSPIPRAALTKSVPLTPSLPLPFVHTSSSSSSVVEPPVDFSSPAQFTPCLDTSAARHRMSVKPRNQRASTKKRVAATDSRSYSRTLNNIDHPECVKEDDQEIGARDEVTVETEQGQTAVPILCQLPSKCPEVAPLTPENSPKSPCVVSQQDNPPSATVLRVKPHRPSDVKERPHSAFTESELKDKRGGVEIQLMSHDKRSALIKTGKPEESSDKPSATFSTVVGFKSSPFHQQVQGEIESIRGLKRPGQGSGSFHVSIPTAKTRDGERPRSGSFVEPLERTEARKKATMRTDDNLSMTEKEEPRDLPPRAGGFTMGRLGQEGSPPKSSVLPWERRDSSKQLESVKTSKNVATDTGPEEVDSNREVVEEAVEAKEVQEEEGKTHTFGIKLRPTSQSMRLRFDASFSRHSKTLVCEEQGDKQKQQEISNIVTCTSTKLPANISSSPSNPGDNQQTDAALSGFSFPGKNNLPSTGDPHILPTEVETKSLNPGQIETSLTAPQDPEPTPQTASSEVSWMSLAMEKTRSLQQLFTSKFPRDFTAVQTTLRPQAQAQSTNQTETSTVKKQPSTTSAQTANQPPMDTVKAETVQSQTQSVKPAQMQVHQKASTASTGLSSSEPQISKQANEPQSTSQPVTHPPVQTSPWTSQSPLHSSTQTETSSPFSQGSTTQPVAQPWLALGQHDTLQQPPWGHRSLHRNSQLKPTTLVPTTSSATTPSPLPTLGRVEREAKVQEKEASPLPGRRPLWGGSVSERAAFLEKQAEPTIPLGTKGVELRKTEAQAPCDSPGSAKTTALSKDTSPEGREVVKPAESSPIKVPDRLREDKWPRKNVASSSPSSSPIQPSALQSMSESGQPSWMELAKRKSMAWSDRTMD